MRRFRPAHDDSNQSERVAILYQLLALLSFAVQVEPLPDGEIGVLLLDGRIVLWLR